MQSTVEPNNPAAQVRATGRRQSAITPTVGNLTHVSDYVKERQALRSDGQGLYRACGEPTAALLTEAQTSTPLELGELQEATMLRCGRHQLLPVTEHGKGDHQTIEVDAIAHRRLLDSMLFINGAGTAAPQVELG
jgi:hypothetical protein